MKHSRTTIYTQRLLKPLKKLPSRGVVHNSCYQKCFTESLKGTCEEIFINFILPVKKRCMLKNFIFIKNGLIQKFCQGFCLFLGSGRTPVRQNTSWEEHLHEVGWFMQVQYCFGDKQKFLRHNEKENLSKRWTTVKSMQ